MKRAAAIYSLFLRVIAIGCLGYIALTSLGIILFLKFLPDNSLVCITSIPIFSTLIVAAFSLFWLFPQNYNWLILVPLAKREIIFLQGLVHLTLFAFLIGSYFVIVGMSDYFVTGGLKELFGVFRHLGNIWQEAERALPKVKSLDEPSTFATALFLGMLLFAALFGAAANRRQGMSFSRFPGWRAFFHSKRVRRVVALLLLAAIFKEFIFSPYGVFTFFTVLMMASIPGSWVQNLALTGRSAKMAFISFLILAVLQLGLIYTVALKKMRQGSEEKVEAMLFLGPFAGHLSQADQVALLESDLSGSSAEKFGQKYLDEFNGGRKLDRQTDKAIDFQKLFASKKTKEGIFGAYKYYDPTTLKASDLKSIYREIARTDYDWSDYRIFYRFVTANVGPEDMRELFDSKDRWQNTYAIMRARYDHHPSYSGNILRNLPRYTGDTLLQALATLSILSGSRVTLEDWHQYRNGRSIATAPHTFDCKNYSPGKFSDLKQSDAGLLNVCLRLRTDRSDVDAVTNLEAIGWFDIPLNSGQQWAVSRVFFKSNE